MPSRRQFLKGSFATAAVALGGSVLVGRDPVARPAGPRIPLHGVVFEPDLPWSASFAAEARRLGVPTFAIEGDITPVWVRLIELWRSTPIAVGGLTTLTPLLLLEQSGRDHGLRVEFRAEHQLGRDGLLVNALSGAPEAIGAFRLSARRGRDYGACVARALVQCPVARGQIDSAVVQTPAPARMGRTPLYSWVLAPRQALSRGIRA